MTINAIKILIPAVIAFASGMFLSPIIITTLTSLKMWKKKSVEKALSGGEAIITKQLHNDENKQVPRMGGLVIWLSVTFAAFTLWVIPHIFQSFPDKIDFVSRNQTWIILAAMIFTGILGAIDDISTSGKHVPFIGDRGLSFYWRLLVVFLLSLLMGWWFLFKLGFVEIFVPFFGLVFIGVLILPLISIYLVGMFSVSVIDGIDGLSGGLFAIAFAAYGIIALAQNQVDIAAFCFAVVGGTAAFLWYNVHPAQFYNSETGLLALATSLTLVAFLTNQILILPIIALPLISAPASSIIQIFSKRVLKRKAFLVAPLHHHFQAAGLDAQTVVLRYWIAGMICAFAGVVFALAGSI